MTTPQLEGSIDSNRIAGSDHTPGYNSSHTLGHTTDTDSGHTAATSIGHMTANRSIATATANHHILSYHNCTAAAATGHSTTNLPGINHLMYFAQVLCLLGSHSHLLHHACMLHRSLHLLTPVYSNHSVVIASTSP